MSRRVGQRKTSSAVLGPYRCTEEEKAEIDATAQYLGLSTSEYLRTLHREKRRQLLDEGKRPPIRPREYEE